MTNDKNAALDALTFVTRTLGWLEVVPPYGDGKSRTVEADKAIRACETIRAALTPADGSVYDLCHEAYEVYANMEGGLPETAYEGFLLQELEKMAALIGKAKLAALTPKADAPEPIEGLGEPDLAFIDGPEQGKFYPILKFDSKEHYTAWMDAARRYRAAQDVAKIAEPAFVVELPPITKSAKYKIPMAMMPLDSWERIAAAISGKGGVG